MSATDNFRVVTAISGEDGTLTISQDDMTWLAGILAQPAKKPTQAMLDASRRRRELLGEDEGAAHESR